MLYSIISIIELYAIFILASIIFAILISITFAQQDRRNGRNTQNLFYVKVLLNDLKRIFKK